MNDDLKAYVDGELPPDAAERLRARLDTEPELALQGEEFRRLSAALRALPEPMPVGQAATLEALARHRPIWRGWTIALAGCAAVLAAVSTLPPKAVSAPTFQQAVLDRKSLHQDPSRDEERSPTSNFGSGKAMDKTDFAPKAPAGDAAASSRAMRDRNGRNRTSRLKPTTPQKEPNP